MDVKMFPATVLRVGEVNGPAKAWLVSLLGSAATDDAEVQISLRKAVTITKGESWTSAMNQRRCDLIDQKYATGISADESAELESLTATMRHYINRVAPVPLEGVRRLHQQLLEQVGESIAKS